MSSGRVVAAAGNWNAGSRSGSNSSNSVNSVVAQAGVDGGSGAKQVTNVSRVARGCRGGVNVRRYRLDRASIREIFVDEPLIEGDLSADGDYIQLEHGGIKTLVHAELYAFASTEVYLAKRTTLGARGLMKRTVNQAIEKKFCTNSFDAYVLARPIVKAVMAMTPAEREFSTFMGDHTIQEHLDEVNDLTSGRIPIQPSPFERCLRMLSLVSAFLMISGSSFVMFTGINWVMQFAGSGVVGTISALVIVLGFVWFAVVEQLRRYNTKFYRIIQEK
jgi:hypothetical protein